MPGFMDVEVRFILRVERVDETDSQAPRLTVARAEDAVRNAVRHALRHAAGEGFVHEHDRDFTISLQYGVSAHVR